LILGFWIVAASSSAPPLAEHPREDAGFDLQAEVPVPKVNITSAEAPVTPEPPIEQQPRTEPPPLAIQEPPTPEPLPVVELPAPPALDLPEVAPVAFFDAGSVVCSCFKDMHQGDTPMLRNWNAIKAASLAVALAVGPVATAQDITQADLENLRKSIDKSITDAADTVKKQIDTRLEKINSDVMSAISGLNADVIKLKSDIKSLNDSSDDTKLKAQTNQMAIKNLEAQVATLKAELDKLTNRGTQLYPADKSGPNEIVSRLAKIEEVLARMIEARVANAPPLSMGRIQLANMYPEEMLFVVNGVNYKLAPYQTRMLENQPSGTFTYEVISGTYGVRANNRPVLEAGKTYTITVH
jgi:hypothetical protein